jgi:hypothetical protein
MNGEPQDGMERSFRSAGWGWILWSGLVLVSYVLSTGPITMLEERKLIYSNTPPHRLLTILYGPVGWAYCETPLHKPLGMYWHLWTPNAIDINGNIK